MNTLAQNQILYQCKNDFNSIITNINDQTNNRNNDICNSETFDTQHLHQSVLLAEVIDYLQIKSNGIYIDATFGLGGYSKAILESNSNVQVIAIDRDDHALMYANPLIEKYRGRFKFIVGCFSQLSELLKNYQNKISGIVFDLGVSSPQLDQPERGFSFRFDGPLDMRMSNQGKTAADIINSSTQAELINILKTYGEEIYARKIVKAILLARKDNYISSTLQLAKLIEKIIPRFLQKIHPATRTFQAIRIAVNDELNELEAGLRASIDLLNHKGRLIAVSFHSLEDRIIKNFIHTHSSNNEINRHSPYIKKQHYDFNKLTKKAILPQYIEIENNSRSRSAKLRAAERIRSDITI